MLPVTKRVIWELSDNFENRIAKYKRVSNF